MALVPRGTMVRRWLVAATLMLAAAPPASASLGTIAESSVSSGVVRRHAIRARAGEYLEFVLEPALADVVARVPTAGLERRTRSHAPVRFRVIAPSKGSVAIEVRRVG